MAGPSREDVAEGSWRYVFEFYALTGACNELEANINSPFSPLFIGSKAYPEVNFDSRK